jgi:hypothetical protein
MNKLSITIAIFYLIMVVVIVVILLIKHQNDADAQMTLIIAIILALGSLFLKPIRQPIELFLNRPSINSSVERICLFGRAGVGKTTFIENTFTVLEPDKVRISTEYFDYYRFSVSTSLKTSAEIEIADYKGQNPSQIIHYGSPEFFGLPQDCMINAVIFIVDLVPRRYNHDGVKEPLNDEALMKWLREGSIIKKIEQRVQEHREYINEASLELFFSSMYSKRLKSAFLLINKLDLMTKLIDDGYLNIGNYSDIHAYVNHLFEPVINNLKEACSELGIDSPVVLSVSSKNRNDLALVINKILSQRS